MTNNHSPLTLNVGTGKGHSVLEVTETFKKEVGVKLNFKIGNRKAGMYLPYMPITRKL